MIITGTGHRPNKLGGWAFYMDRGHNLLTELIKEELTTLSKKGIVIEKINSGMAMGFDSCLAQAALELNIPLAAYVPFPGHHTSWGNWSQSKYGELLVGASERHIVCSKEDLASGKVKSHVQALFIRNEAMVDNSDVLMVLLDPQTRTGGTWGCVQYAINKSNIKMHCIWKKME